MVAILNRALNVTPYCACMFVSTVPPTLTDQMLCTYVRFNVLYCNVLVRCGTNDTVCHTYVRTNHVADKHTSFPTLPVVVVKRKTLVLDLDETLIHAQRDG